MIIDFLKTTTTKDDLRAALTVLREFKGCESNLEYVLAPFMCWVKLEQLEEFLDHLVNGTPLKADTVAVLRESAEQTKPEGGS